MFPVANNYQLGTDNWQLIGPWSLAFLVLVSWPLDAGPWSLPS